MLRSLVQRADQMLFSSDTDEMSETPELSNAALHNGVYEWIADGAGGYRCTKAPAEMQHLIGLIVNAQNHVKAYETVRQLEHEQQPERAPAAEAVADPAQVESENASEEPTLSQGSASEVAPEGGGSAVFDAFPDLTRAADGVRSLVAGAKQAVQSATVGLELSWWSQDITEENAPGQDLVDGPEQGVPEGFDPVPEDPMSLLDQPTTDVLENGIRLASWTDVGHPDDGNDSKYKPWSALKKGSTAGLPSIRCHEFTAASMAASGYDLDTYYHDPKTGLRVAYKEQNKNEITNVRLFMLIGNFAEANAAILDVQKGTGRAERVNPKEIDATSEDPMDVQKREQPGEFWFVTVPNNETLTFRGMKAAGKTKVYEGDVFGAGAAAVGLGGYTVELKERKPGDVQQRNNVHKGLYTGKGHSSIIHAVRGYGIAWVGAAGSPKLELGTKELRSQELQPGWYRIDEGSGLEWVLGPATDPELVAEFTGVQTQLIDANTASTKNHTGEARGKDATQVGAFEANAGMKPEEQLNSTGRLPHSPWFKWAGHTPDGVIDLKPTDAPALEDECRP